MIESLLNFKAYASLTGAAILLLIFCRGCWDPYNYIKNADELDGEPIKLTMEQIDKMRALSILGAVVTFVISIYLSKKIHPPIPILGSIGL